MVLKTKMFSKLPPELIDNIYTYADIDTKLSLRKLYPCFRFTEGKVKDPFDPQLDIYALDQQKHKHFFSHILISSSTRVLGMSGLLYSS